MRVEELNFPENVTLVLKEEISELNPPQAAAVKSGLLDGKNLVVASPTASGKTFIAEMAVIKNFLNGGKAVYLVPLKALGSEKYEEFRKKYERIGMKVALSVGDMDGDDPWLQRYDLIIASNEKMDSLLRHGAGWVSSITLIVADEIHLLNDVSRGPTLEVVLTRLRDVAKAQILALSATIQNSDEISKWLDAKLVKSDYRPVKLHSGVFLAPEIEFLEKEKCILEGEEENEIILSRDTLSKNKQSLVFLATRASAEAAAERIGKAAESFLSSGDKEQLSEISKNVLSALSNPTKQCKRLASVLKNGVAFHHAGLVAKQRKIIEDSFRSGTIKILAATPTLSFGLNLPAWRVVVRDTKRYGGYGADYIPAMEIHQMFGRAGRPKYDSDGEAVLVAKSKNEAKELWERYILGGPEPIYSKLSVEPVLRMHVLALIAGEVAGSSRALEQFFSKTFFAHQYKDMGEVMAKVDKILRALEEFKFIKTSRKNFISEDFVPAFELHEDVKLYATPLGKRVSELYIDPLSAHHIILNFEKQPNLDYLLTINQCTEMWPLLNVREKEMDEMEELLAKYEIRPPDAWDMEYEKFLREFKTSLMFVDWINESGEDSMLEKYGITPGELYNKTSRAEWLFYAARELALVLGKRDIANSMNKMRLRVKHGIKEELVRLVKLRGIGRARARLLFKSGIKSPADMKKSPQAVESVLGKKVAGSIMREL